MGVQSRFFGSKLGKIDYAGHNRGFIPEKPLAFGRSASYPG